MQRGLVRLAFEPLAHKRGPGPGDVMTAACFGGIAVSSRHDEGEDCAGDASAGFSRGVRREPVTITNEGRDEFVVLSAEECPPQAARPARWAYRECLRNGLTPCAPPRCRTNFAGLNAELKLRVPLPAPVPGLVIRYRYLWHTSSGEHLADREEGQKDRPCPIVATIPPAEDAGETGALALPVTHGPPADAAPAVEIPARVKERCGSTPRAPGSSSLSGMK